MGVIPTECVRECGPSGNDRPHSSSLWAKHSAMTTKTTWVVNNTHVHIPYIHTPRAKNLNIQFTILVDQFIHCQEMLAFLFIVGLGLATTIELYECLSQTNGCTKPLPLQSTSIASHHSSTSPSTPCTQASGREDSGERKTMKNCSKPRRDMICITTLPATNV